MDVEQNKELTKDKILQLSLRLAEYFKKNCNVKTGDFIALICKNRWEFAVITLACVFLKCTFSPLNPNYTKRKYRYLIKYNFIYYYYFATFLCPWWCIAI